jgi:hypothetical protein
LSKMTASPMTSESVRRLYPWGAQPGRKPSL